MATTYTLTGSLLDAGVPFVGDKALAWIALANVNALIDTTTDSLVVGRWPVATDGTGDLSEVLPSTASGAGYSPDGGFAFQLYIEYRDSAPYATRERFVSQPFTLTANSTLADVLGGTIELRSVSAAEWADFQAKYDEIKDVVATTDGVMAAAIVDPGSEMAAALSAMIAEMVGAVFEVSDTAPVDTTRYGVPVIWIDPNHPPVVTITNLTHAGLDATLAWTLTDTDAGDTLTSVVDWGDGSADTSPATSPATHTYATAGTYTVTLTSTDGLVTVTDSDVVTVAPAGPNVADYFTAADATALSGRSTPVGAKTWTSPFAGTGYGGAALAIASNAVASAGGEARFPVTQQNLRADINYDVTATGGQACVNVRSPLPSGGVKVQVKKNGDVGYSLDSDSFVALGTGQPNTGKLSAKVVGTVLQVYVNDVQIGSNVTISQTGDGVAIGLFSNGKILDIEVYYL